jgi:hypothetical protein
MRAARPAVLSLIAVFGCGLAACGGGNESSPTPAKPSAPDDAPAPSEAHAPSKPKEPRGPIDPAKVGTIRGTVRFEGDAPERKPLPIGGTGGCPEHATPPLSEDAIVSNGLLANTFVWIKDGLAGWDLPPPRGASASMDQKGCIYAPHVLGLRAGDTLLVRNTDPTSHNVNIRSHANDALNPIQPPNGQPVEWRPTKKELGVSFECNLHPWMRAYVCVVDEPWFAVTGADGSFSLEGVPPGDYVLETWHEKYGKKTASVSLAPGGTQAVALTYKATDKPR